MRLTGPMPNDDWQIELLDLDGYLGRLGVPAREPSRSALAELHEVLRPVEVNSGTVEPWFEQPGGGTQYEFAQPIESLVQQGFLRRVP